MLSDRYVMTELSLHVLVVLKRTEYARAARTEVAEVWPSHSQISSAWKVTTRHLAGATPRKSRLYSIGQYSSYNCEDVTKILTIGEYIYRVRCIRQPTDGADGSSALATTSGPQLVRDRGEGDITLLPLPHH